MPTATASVYKKFYRYNTKAQRTNRQETVHLTVEELQIDSFASINIEFSKDYTILEGTVRRSVMLGQKFPYEFEVQESFSGDSFRDALDKAKEAGATNIRRIFG